MLDRFVVVDWSANSSPKLGRDSIWIAVHDGHVAVVNVPTRSAALAMLLDLLADDVPTLLGVDFSLGYPVGTAHALGLEGVAWAATWRLLGDTIRDDDRNRNNRFAVAAECNRRMSGAATPFWGRPARHDLATLATTKPGTTGPVGEWRTVESRLRNDGRRPFSSWQLLGAGAVGSQSLLGIATMSRLVDALGDRATVWPFTTGLRPPGTARGTVVVAEVWPSLHPIDGSTQVVRDAAQVETTANWLASMAATDELAALFAPAVAPSLRSAVIEEEGWILGVR